MEARQIPAGQLRHAVRGAGSGQRAAVSVILAVNQRGQHPQPHRDGRYALAVDRGQLQLLLPREIGFGKRRIQHDVGEQIERGVQLVLQSAQINAGLIHVRVRPELRAQQLKLLADFEGGAFLRAVDQRGGGELRRPRRGERIGGVARVHGQPEIHGRQIVPGGQLHLQSIRKRAVLDGGNLQRRRRAGHGKLRAVGAGPRGLVVGERMHFELIHAVAQPPVRGAF